jgi:Ti-type conjugative transfer relaxase TraA
MSRDLSYMVSIGKVGGRPAAERYYTDTVARGQEDYYSGEGEAEGEWTGTAAQQLGLNGGVDADDFSALLRGTAPSGDRLRREPDARSVIGFDLTFSAPKSVSVLYGVGDPAISQATREAHDEAVQQALGYLERAACRTRRGRGGKQHVRGDGLVVATFRHRTSRAGDLQLHTHAVVANMTRADGRWSALDGRAIYAHARTAGFLYQAALRGELSERLGVEWGPVRRGVADVQGIDPAVLAHFSRRSKEIRERMDELGARSAKAAELAALETRRTKEYDVPVDRLREEWRARAAEHGLSRDELQRVIGRSDVERRAPEPLGPTFLDSHEGLTREASTFDRRDVLREWAEAHRDGAPVEDLEWLADRWLASPSAVRLEGSTAAPGGARFSTPEMLATERELIDVAERRRGVGTARAEREYIDAALAARPELAAEQADVVRGLTGSGDGVEVVRAPAGTGKTYALEAARDAWEASGSHVVGCALSARAAVELESQSGIDSTTIARLQIDLDRGFGLAEDDVLIVDEAGMVGSRALAALSRHTDAVGAKLVLVGDDRQLPEIDAGGAFRGLAERVGALELHETRRQKHEWDRDALARLRVGQIDAWAAPYREAGRLVARSTARATRDELVADWWHSARRTDVDAVMIAHRRSDVADLNERARALMDADGRLGSTEVEAAGRAFACGDRVLARHNDRRAGIVNGARGHVVAVDEEQRSVTVRLQSDRNVVLDSAYLDEGHLDHGYALTAHAAQGATVDRAFVLGSDDLYREWGYTALTRHREEARFYLVSPGSVERALPGLEPESDDLLQDLTEMLGDSRQKSLAIDVLGDEPLPDADAREGLLAGYHAIVASERRGANELAAAEAARAESEARVAVLREERATVGPFQRHLRSELDIEISANEAACDRWATLAEERRERAVAVRVEREAWLDSNAPALRNALARELASQQHTSLERENALRDLIAERTYADRPDALGERDRWAMSAVQFADIDLELPALEAPGPDLDMPEFDLGP